MSRGYINHDWQYNSVSRYRLKANWMYFDRFAKVCPYIDFQLIFCPLLRLDRFIFSAKRSEFFIYFLFSCLLCWLRDRLVTLAVSSPMYAKQTLWRIQTLKSHRYSFLSIRRRVFFFRCMFTYSTAAFFLYLYE